MMKSNFSESNSRITALPFYDQQPQRVEIAGFGREPQVFAQYMNATLAMIQEHSLALELVFTLNTLGSLNMIEQAGQG